jgi:hypothetical protein
LIISNSLIHLSLLEEYDAEIVVDIGVCGFEFQGFFVMSNGLIHLSLEEKSIAKIVVD